MTRRVGGNDKKRYRMKTTEEKGHKREKKRRMIRKDKRQKIWKKNGEKMGEKFIIKEKKWSWFMIYKSFSKFFRLMQDIVSSILRIEKLKKKK